MRIRSRVLSFIWKIIIAALAAVGVLMRVGLIGEGMLYLEALGSFGVVVGALAALYFLIDAIWILAKRAAADAGHEFAIGFKHVILMGTIMTGVISNTVLASQYVNASGLVASSLQLIHIFLPVFVVLDWLLFEHKGQMRPLSPLVCLILPLGYFFGVVTAVGVFKLDLNTQVSSVYPYAFMDITRIPGQQLALGAVGALASFVAVGYAIFAIDRLMANAVEKHVVSAPAADTRS